MHIRPYISEFSVMPVRKAIAKIWTELLDKPADGEKSGYKRVWAHFEGVCS
jgi:hypothetical protein